MADDEPSPTLDGLPGWPTPEEQPEWHGAEDSEATLRRAFEGGRLPHAWLLAGAKGIGKATLAFRFARFILASSDPSLSPEDTWPALAVDPDIRTARQIAARAHPNLLVLRRPWDPGAKRFRSDLTVGEVRRIQRFFGATAGEPGWRICIVDTTDDLNVSAANALLKTLEEPPERGLFLLVANRPGQLPATIRSRCARLDLKPLSAEAMSRVVLANDPEADASDLNVAVRLAGGSLRRAIQFLQLDQASTYRAFSKLTTDLPLLDFSGVHELADAVAARGRDEEFEGFIEVVSGWLSRRIRGVDEPAGQVAPAARAASLASWAGVWEKVRQSSLQAETLNLDRRQVVLQVFMALANAARM